MRSVKKLFVYCALFNPLSVFAMGNSTSFQLRASNSSGLMYPVNNRSMEHALPVSNKARSSQTLFRTKKEEKIARNNIILNEIRDKIDENHLGLAKDVWLRRALGTVQGYCKSCYVTDQQAIDELNKIESYVPKNNKEHFLGKLEEKHLYVKYLMQRAVGTKINEISMVKGSTVDLLYNPTTQKGFARMVHVRALNEYFYPTAVSGHYNDVPRGHLGDIHCAVLYGHKHDIKPKSLQMSSEGNYLQSTDVDENTIVWNMERGEAIYMFYKGLYEWIVGVDVRRRIDGPGKFPEFHIVRDRTDTYFAEVVTPNSPYVNSPLKIENKPAIFLFKKPQEESYLSQEAFYNSKGNLTELNALKESKTFAAIKGFPKKNLEKLIQKEIDESSAGDEYTDYTYGW